MRSTIASVLTAFALAGVSQAADCYNTPSNWFYGSVYDDAWSVRNAVCNGNGDKWAGHVHGTSNTPGGSSCWDAMENIINQCIYGENKPGGQWTANGQNYYISMTAS
ncbi:uncharacterized protein E0L32_001263 [Thyridium curvatum]|uniref:Uncharacterized protein n=1 Tax=Thyridium curvatum TaxID=1093900 RepID=A0A507ATP2_9PEZI|nr:uncharacterized protein E0L32_001263 [Thyridium curvatum]TPX10066.1 hypothetical protein E0L32_001263 [Thyridium curvatum]